MNIRFLFLIIAVAGTLIVAPRNEAHATKITGWGTVIDSDDDCTFEVGDGSVTITLPETKHDLWYGGKNESTRFNSPRVLQEFEGNFIATVRVTADWEANIADGGYNGAGLVVWDSESQYLRHERNRFVNRYSRELTYTTPLYDQNNRRVFYTSTSEDFFQGNSTWLRITRYNATIVTEISHDGSTWTTTGVVASEFPDTVQIGIHATNSTGKPFPVTYDQFSVTKR